MRHLETAVALRPGDGNSLQRGLHVRPARAEARGTRHVQRAVEAGYGNMEWAARDQDLISLHDEPDFRQLVGLKPV